jgi:hypothetical protein
MPSIKCPSCGHRMLRPNATQTCTNCGAPLLPPELMEEEGQQALVVYGSSQVAPVRPAQVSEEQLRALQPYPTSAQQIVPAHQQALDVNPFDASAASVPQVFTGSAEVSMAPVEEPWDSGSLPRGFPKRPPDISGTLVLVQSQHEIRRNSGLGKALVDAIFPMPNDTTAANKERQVNVTTLRIRNSSDGVQQDARMEGYLKGANISIGDTISLWGRRYKGSLVIYRGYNHTTKSVVMTNTMTSPMPVLILLLLMLAVFFLLSSYMHLDFLPDLHQFLH